jgi:hypothetical protein
MLTKTPFMLGQELALEKVFAADYEFVKGFLNALKASSYLTEYKTTHDYF